MITLQTHSHPMRISADHLKIQATNGIQARSASQSRIWSPNLLSSMTTWNYLTIRRIRPSIRLGTWPSSIWRCMILTTTTSSTSIRTSARPDSNPSMITCQHVCLTHTAMALPKRNRCWMNMIPLVKGRVSMPKSNLPRSRTICQMVSKMLIWTSCHHQSRSLWSSFSSIMRNPAHKHHQRSRSSPTNRRKLSRDTSAPWSMTIPNASRSSWLSGRKPRDWEEKLMPLWSNQTAFSSSASSTSMMNHTTTLSDQHHLIIYTRPCPRMSDMKLLCL